MVSEPTTASIGVLYHIGISVHDVERSVQFWRRLTGAEPLWRKVLDGSYLADVTGYPGIAIDAAMIELPDGPCLEILDYRVSRKTPNDMSTANPGNVHLCFRVTDIVVSWNRALDAGATPISPGPVPITEGPNCGASACYMRDPDGVTIEFFEPAPRDPAKESRG